MNKSTSLGIGAAVILALVVGYFYFGSDSSDADAPADGAERSAQGSASSSAATRGGGGGRASRGSRPPPLVVASDVTRVLINDRLKAVGNGTAQASVSVVPLTGGILTEVLVSSGERVEANAVLATLDSEEQQIARDRAAREAVEAQNDTTRLEKLFRTRTTTQVELNRARALVNDAQLALRDAELKLERRTITAPIAGIVGFVAVDTGNYIDARTELLTIDDRSRLNVEFWVPERFANQLSLGQEVQATALADPGTRYVGQVNGIGSRIEQDSRTLPVRALIENADDRLRPGMSFELQLNFPGQNYPAVNPLSMQWDSDGSYVWKIVDQKVQKVPARIVQRNPDTVLVDADLAPGDRTVSEGLLSLRPGATVRIEGEPVQGGRPASGADSGDALQAKPATSTAAGASTGS